MSLWRTCWKTDGLSRTWHSEQSPSFVATQICRASSQTKPPPQGQAFPVMSMPGKKQPDNTDAMRQRRRRMQKGGAPERR